jgi:uncharacterized protein
MKRDMTVAGPLTVDLWLRSSVQHTDVSVRLCVVSAKGSLDNVSDGYLRLPEDVTAAADGTLHVGSTCGLPPSPSAQVSESGCR